MRPSSRPFIAFAILLLCIFVPVAISDAMRYGTRHLFETIVFAFALYASFAIVLLSRRVDVSDDGIVLTTLFVRKRLVRFADIDHSDVHVLVERDWPVFLVIYGRERSRPIAQIALKPLAKEDAQWLCSLPQLKVTGRKNALWKIIP